MSSFARLFCWGIVAAILSLRLWSCAKLHILLEPHRAKRYSFNLLVNVTVRPFLKMKPHSTQWLVLDTFPSHGAPLVTVTPFRQLFLCLASDSQLILI